MQLLSYVHCFIGFAFEIDHVQQGGERMESGGTVTCLGGMALHQEKCQGNEISMPPDLQVFA